MVDVARYARHISLPQIGIAGQRRLNDARVLIIGAGGLGSPVALYLASAGIGTIGIVDDDVVDVSNLQRQILHDTSKIGTPKVESARQRLNEVDPNVEVIIFQERLTPMNIGQIFEHGWDVVVDGTDNIPTRYLIDDACFLTHTPWIYGSIYRFEGQVSTFNLNNGPCYRDLFPTPPPSDAVPSCAEGGVLGILPGLIGTVQATEVVKLVLGIGEVLSGRLMLYDALSMSFTELSFSHDLSRPKVTDLSQTAQLFSSSNYCTLPTQKGHGEIQMPVASPVELMVTNISMAEIQAKRAEGWTPFILDVRSELEYDDGHLRGCSLHIPHEQVLSVMDQLPTDQDILVHCKGGMRSQMAIMMLMSSGFDGTRLYNVDGGIMAWQRVAPEEIV